MAGKFGTKETKEVLNLVKAAAIAIVLEVKKDGFQAADIFAFLKSAEFETALMPAIQGLEDVTSELSELGVIDTLDLGRYGYAVMDDILAAMKAAPKKA